jgi:abortive infection bacteriophage resistance protein
MNYSKQALNISQQIELLKSRGLIIEDTQFTRDILENVSYFRIANYLRPMESDKLTHQFKPGASFRNVVSLYDFDRELRLLVFGAISRIEIALRTRIIHHFSLSHGPFWFEDSNLALDGALYTDNITTLNRELHRSKEDFIKEHFKKYDNPDVPPAWKTLEVISFGTLSKMYFNFKDTSVKKDVARSLGLPQHLILESWIASLAALRNCCAHHARIWNRNYPVTPNIPKKLPGDWIVNRNFQSNKLYVQLCTIAYLLNVVKRNNNFAQQLTALLFKYPNVDVFAMGFSVDWRNESLWSLSQ